MKSCKNPTKILLSIGVLIMLYWLCLKAVFQNNIINNDFMNHKVFDLKLLENCCSLWPISHFVLFAIMGYMYPNCGVSMMVLGVLWELFEMGWSHIFLERRQKMYVNGDIEYSKNWWAGSFKDILFNFLGFIIGSSLS